MKTTTVLVSTACLCAAGSAAAAEWSAAPVLSWTLDHDSNRLLNDRQIGSQAAWVNLDVALRRATPGSVYALQPHVGFQRYTNGVSQNANEQSLLAAGTWMGPRSQRSAQFSYSRDNSLNNELPEDGAFTGTTRRVAKLAATSWSWQATDRNQMSAQASYTDTRYEYQNTFTLFGLTFPVSNLYGYEYPTVSVSDNYRLSENGWLQFSAYAGRLMPHTAATGESDNYGAQVGWSGSLTSRVSLLITAGVSRQSSDASSESGYLGRFELKRVGPVGQWRLYASRNVTAGSYGYLVTQDEAGVALDRKVTPRWSMYGGLRGFRSEDIGAGPIQESRVYARAETGIAWDTSRTWRVRSGVSFTRARQSAESPLANGWGAFLSAEWTAFPSKLSR